MPMDLLALAASIVGVLGALLAPVLILFYFVQKSPLMIIIGFAIGILLMLLVLDYWVTPYVNKRLNKTLGRTNASS